LSMESKSNYSGMEMDQSQSMQKKQPFNHFWLINDAKA